MKDEPSVWRSVEGGLQAEQQQRQVVEASSVGSGDGKNLGSGQYCQKRLVLCALGDPDVKDGSARQERHSYFALSKMGTVQFETEPHNLIILKGSRRLLWGAAGVCCILGEQKGLMWRTDRIRQ